MSTAEENEEIDDEDDIFNKDKAINEEVDNEVSQLLGEHKVYGENDPSKMSTLPGDKTTDVESKPNATSRAAPMTATDAARFVANDAVGAFMSGTQVKPQSKAAEAAARAVRRARAR